MFSFSFIIPSLWGGGGVVEEEEECCVVFEEEGSPSAVCVDYCDERSRRTALPEKKADWVICFFGSGNGPD